MGWNSCEENRLNSLAWPLQGDIPHLQQCIIPVKRVISVYYYSSRSENQIQF